MASPTIEDMLSWPEPNYDHPHGPLDPVIYGVVLPLTAVMTLAVAGRFITRTVLVRNALGADDWTMLVAYILAMAMSIGQIIEMRFGVGRHVYDVRVEWFSSLGKLTLAIQCIFAPCAAITKTSICLTYLRLFPSKTNKWFNYICIFILVGFGISTMIGMLLQCRPISDMWDLTKPAAEKHCINSETFFIAVAAINSLTDFMVYLWPIHYLWNVQISVLKRIGLIVSFGIGILICIAGIIRIKWQVIYAHSWDQTYNGAVIFVIVAVEINLGVICGCLPGIRPLLMKMVPNLGSWSYGSAKGRGTTAYGSSVQTPKSRGEFRDTHSIHVRNDVELSVMDKATMEHISRSERNRFGETASQEWIARPEPWDGRV